MNNSHLGFVVLSYNSEKYIGRCLSSIVTLNKYVKDIVIVDNGSKDSSVEIISEFKDDETTHIELIRHNRNYGTTVTRNEALHYLLAKNVDYICILDSDAFINEEVVDKLIEVLKNNEKCLIVGPKLVYENGQNQISARNFPTFKEKLLRVLPIKRWQEIALEKSRTVSYDYTKEYRTDYLVSACWLVKTELFEKVGLFFEKYFYAPEDCDLCIRVWNNKYEVIHVPQVSMIHIYQQKGRKRFFSKLNYSHVKGLLYFFNKYRKDLNRYRRMKNEQH